MAGPWQWLGGALGLLQLTLHICLLYPPLSALPWVAGDSKPPTQGFAVVKGTFSRHFLNVGYHKVVEIPAGARNISIQETTKSRNYLALKTQSGVSIINGNWGIDRPGVFIAVGTQLTYRRPNEIRSRLGESIVAPGPITEDVSVYLIYQQPDPGVYYEYSVPLYNTQPSAEPQTPPDIMSLVETVDPVRTHRDSIIGDIGSNEIPKDTPNHGQGVPEAGARLPAYTWSPAGHTVCSATCGTGRREALWRCVDAGSRLSASDDLCDLALRPPTEDECVAQPCPAHWDLGEWSECSRRCGPGSQHRQVICRQVTHTHANRTEMVATVGAELCDATDSPLTRASCQLKICSQWQIRSEWSACSVPCGVGQRSREVVCLGDLGDVEEDSECNLAMKPPTLENCDMGACARSWFTSNWSRRCSAECGEGSQTRTALCLMDHVTNLPLDSCEGARPPEVTSCNLGPCEKRLEWYTGPWGQCSAECGNGTQTRSAACLLNSNGSMGVVDQLKCSHLPQPITAQPCFLEPCGGQWYSTDWSACSASCGGGYRVREVRCVADSPAPGVRCDPASAPESREQCNAQQCVAEDTDSACRDQYNNCAVVVQARLCVYAYYRAACCTSCSSAPKPYAHSFVKKHLHR